LVPSRWDLYFLKQLSENVVPTQLLVGMKRAIAGVIKTVTKSSEFGIKHYLSFAERDLFNAATFGFMHVLTCLEAN
jgi:hypothetical protein